MNAIEVHDLRKNFKEIPAVKGVSFQIPPGEIFGFLGPNGAGKTTTINILCTLLTPTAGTALVAGHDVVRERDQVRRKIGIVFQDRALDERLTAFDNMQLHAILYNVPARELPKRIDAALATVELLDRKKSLVRTFSGGMKRRLEIARGLLHTPEVLFLDEPTVGLDPQTRRAIWDYIQKLHQKRGLTIFMTTHYMEEAEVCHRIAIIDHGKIIALDTPANLKRLVGGDVVILKTSDDAQAAAEIQSRFHLPVSPNGQGLRLEVEGGEQFIPTLIRDLPTTITSISLHRPTLEDVFVKLTGRAIREEGPESMLRVGMRMWGRR
ncbi:MAG: ATP-binding cassette domain-containing protein [Deinococcus sp.]|nr:ATP-binding cassette domain-containing protein [Deinococcus sp.]